MLSKNLYLAMSILLFVPLIVLYFQNVTYGTSMVFFSDLSGSIALYFWPLVIIAGGLGAALTLYVQKLLKDIDVSNQAGGLNL